MQYRMHIALAAILRATVGSPYRSLSYRKKLHASSVVERGPEACPGADHRSNITSRFGVREETDLIHYKIIPSRLFYRHLPDPRRPRRFLQLLKHGNDVLAQRRQALPTHPQSLPAVFPTQPPYRRADSQPGTPLAELLRSQHSLHVDYLAVFELLAVPAHIVIHPSTEDDSSPSRYTTIPFCCRCRCRCRRRPRQDSKIRRPFILLIRVWTNPSPC